MTDKMGITSYAGAAIATVTGAAGPEWWAMAGGLTLGAATFAVNWWYKRRTHEMRKQERDTAIEADAEKLRYYKHRRQTDD